MANKYKTKSFDTVEDVMNIKKKMGIHAKVLIILGAIGIISVSTGLIWYVVSHSVNHTSIRFSVMLYYIMSIIIATAMLSAGNYMLKTSRLIDRGIKNKINNLEESVDDKKE